MGDTTQPTKEGKTAMNEATKKTRQPKKQLKKEALTYAITPAREDEIKSFVDAVHAKTRMPKEHIISELLIEGIRRAKAFYQV